jgi:hypothetical protein
VRGVILIAARRACAILSTDRSWTVLLDKRIAKDRSAQMSKPLPAIHRTTDVILVPGEVAGAGNVTGGRKLARHNFAPTALRRPVWRFATSKRIRAAPFGRAASLRAQLGLSALRRLRHTLEAIGRAAFGG